MPAGRPTKYKPEYCQKLVEHMRQGGSFETFGAVVSCVKQTLYDWTAQHPEFLYAKKEGELLAYKFFEDVAKAGMTGTLTRVKSRKFDEDGNVISEEREPATFNATVWIFSMKNRFGWRDKRDIEIGGKEGRPIEIVGRDERTQRIEGLLDKARLLNGSDETE